MGKKKEVTIKREMINGKAFMVLRERGKLIEKRVWSSRPDPKNIKVSKREALAHYKENRSIYDDRRRVTKDTWKVVEETRFTQVQANKKSDVVPKIERRRGVDYRYYIRGYIIRSHGGNVEVAASSKSHPSDYPISDARNEAWTSFHERIDFEYHGRQQGRYDENEGVKIVESGNVKIVEEGIIQYKSKPLHHGGHPPNISGGYGRTYDTTKGRYV